MSLTNYSTTVVLQAGTLLERGLTAVKWNYLGVATLAISQLVARLRWRRSWVLRRLDYLLSPSLVLSLGSVIVDMGLGSAFVQRSNLTDDDIRRAFTRLLVAGLAALIIFYTLSGALSEFFNDRRVEPVIRWVTPIFLLHAMAVVPSALLRRNLQFKTVQRFYACGINLRFLGAGVWSLVSALITTNILVS
jgi:hypothetical protein